MTTPEHRKGKAGTTRTSSAATHFPGLYQGRQGEEVRRVGIQQPSAKDLFSRVERAEGECQAIQNALDSLDSQISKDMKNLKLAYDKGIDIGTHILQNWRAADRTVPQVHCANDHRVPTEMWPTVAFYHRHVVESYVKAITEEFGKVIVSSKATISAVRESPEQIAGSKSRKKSLGERCYRVERHISNMEGTLSRLSNMENTYAR